MSGQAAISDNILAASVATLRERGGEKWLRHGEHVLPAFVADMDFAVPDAVQDAVAAIVARRSYGYPWARADGLTVADAFARRMHRTFDWTVESKRVRILTDVVQGLAACIQAFTEPGDGVVVQTPAYPPLLRVVARMGRRLVEHPLVENGARFVLDPERLAEAADDRTRMVLFCHPHNPTGRVFDAGELSGLRDIALERDLIVVSDEIHADLVYPPNRHVPLASIDSDLAARTVTLTSATKSFNVAALRCAVAHLGSIELAERFDRACPAELIGQVTHLSAEATIAAWENSEDWLEEVRAVLAANRARVIDWVGRELTGARCHPPDATYLAWIDCRALGLSPDPLAFFLDRGRVALKGGRDFGDAGAGFVRLNFATPPTILEAVLERMSAAVGASA